MLTCPCSLSQATALELISMAWAPGTVQIELTTALRGGWTVKAPRGTTEESETLGGHLVQDLTTVG